MNITDTDKKTIHYYYIDIKNTPTEMVSAIRQFVNSYGNDADIGITAGNELQIEILKASLTDFTAEKAASVFSHTENKKHSWHTVLLAIDNCSRGEILPAIKSTLKNTKQNLILLCTHSYWKDKTKYFNSSKEIVLKWRETHPQISSNPNYNHITPKENLQNAQEEKTRYQPILSPSKKQNNPPKEEPLWQKILGKIIYYALITICVLGIVIDFYIEVSDGIEKLLHPDQVVEITTNGIRYHTSDCPTISDLPKRSVSLKRALKKERTPCKVCRPISNPK